MSGKFEHKVLNFEIPPPEHIWKNISDQLNEELKVEEIRLSRKMTDFEVIPPSTILGNILSTLNAGQKPETPGRIYRLPGKQLAIAAVTLGLVAIGLLYLFKPGSSSTARNSTAEIIPLSPKITPGQPSRVDENQNANISPPSPALASSSGERATRKKPVYTGNAYVRNARNTRNASLNSVHATLATSAISVTAPPIFDGDGNIIMDETLISAPDENYIIVTSPNGEQTKISRKFIKMLSVMNSDISRSYMSAESSQWKIRFEEWRSKLLQQASYIPTANNFLDIMDLKEMLQEN